MVFKRNERPISGANQRKPKRAADTPAFDQNSTSSSSKDAPVFFWKDDQENGWLCQWYRSTFTDPETGSTFTCAEQWMMYHKAVTFGDMDTAAQILKASSPRKQKGLGTQVVGFDEGRWSQVRSEIVERGNWLKFTQATNIVSISIHDERTQPEPLKELLLATGDRELTEASPFDRIWGIGFKVEEAMKVPREQWGENLLGKALMKVRDRLRQEAEAESRPSR